MRADRVWCLVLGEGTDRETKRLKPPAVNPPLPPAIGLADDGVVVVVMVVGGTS